MATDTPSPPRATSSSPHGAEGHPQRWLILGVLCLCLVMVVASVSSINIAIPSIQRALGASGSQLQWIVDSYALVFAGLLLPAGAIGDRFGRKWTLLGGLVLYAFAAIVASRSNSANQIIGMRSVMGAAAAFIMPSTLSLLTSVFPPHERPKAIAMWAGFAGAGGAIGVVSSGLLLKWFWWGSVFFVTVPLIVVAIALIVPIVPSSRDDERRPLDPLGALFSAGGFFALVFAIIEGPEKGWGHGIVIGSFVAAIVLLGAFVRFELAARHPMLDPRYFRNQRFAMGSLSITLMFFLSFAQFFMASQYLQFVKGYTPLSAGLGALPFALTMIIVAPRGPLLARRITVRRTIALGMTLSALGAIGLGFIRPGTPYAVYACLLSLMACGTGLSNPSATASIMTSLPINKAGVGSAVNDTTREVGGALGIALVGSIAVSIYRRAIRDDLAALPPELADRARDSIGQAVHFSQDATFIGHVRDGFTRGFNTAMTIAGAVVLCGAAAIMRWYPKQTELGRSSDGH